VPSPAPIASIIIANFNGEKFLRSALLSALKQTLDAIEVIVIDDASTDGSLGIARSFALQDDRIRVIARQTQSGPGAARNAGLAVANGRWIAVLDNDDLIHPCRLEQLIEEAELANADIVADDLLVFQDDQPATTHLSPRQRNLGWISAAEFIRQNCLYSREPALGYLKPVIRTAFIRQFNIKYDPDLRIGEDYDLVVQLLAKGARFRIVDTLGYFYRKHSNSISHRMTEANLVQMLAADARLSALFPKEETDVMRAFATRRSSIDRASAFSAVISALKSGDLRGSIGTAVRHPSVISLLHMPIISRLRKLWPQPPRTTTTDDCKQVCLISRQRLIGNTNGSSTYLLALVKALRDAGYRITLIAPSPATLGRWPFLRLRPEMDVFDEIHMRGALRFGKRLYIAKDPRVAISALAATVSRLAGRLGVKLPAWDRPAPYAIAAPWDRGAQLFIARHAPSSIELVLADYAFTTPAIPYALAPAGRSAVVMHDFFSSRAESFKAQKETDSAVVLDQASEMRLLRQADAILAIQQQEALSIRSLLPDRKVILTPLACRMAHAPQPGDNKTLLFVGSNTAPNIIGLKWFFASVWPEVRKRAPDCRLLVCGSVSVAFGSAIPGVRFLGLVPDLDPLYAEAGVAISPLTVGSGLKIKLIDALGQGKAIVATSVTTEGCSQAVVDAVFERDDPQAFAQAILDLLTDAELRREKAGQAFDVASKLYSPEACYREFLDFSTTARIHQHVAANGGVEEVAR
jgi:succinoglycan biosynthesis protein ExoO